MSDKVVTIAGQQVELFLEREATHVLALTGAAGFDEAHPARNRYTR